jgi:lipopolysaccharide transport system ATP-binding protein
VAAHLEPEILVIDEVLAVGDAQFQKKCLGKMRSISHGDGRTIIFVSHQMSTVSALCSVAVRLSNGSLVDKGKCSDVIKAHLKTAPTATELCFEARSTKPTITRISLNADALANGDFALELDFESPFSLRPPVPGIVISSPEGIPVFGSNPRFHKEGNISTSRSSGTLRMQADAIPLASGTYVLSAWLGDWQSDYDHRPDALEFEFYARSSGANRPSSSIIGYLEWPVKWTMNSD